MMVTSPWQPYHHKIRMHLYQITLILSYIHVYFVYVVLLHALTLQEANKLFIYMYRQNFKIAHGYINMQLVCELYLLKFFRVLLSSLSTHSQRSSCMKDRSWNTLDTRETRLEWITTYKQKSLAVIKTELQLQHMRNKLKAETPNASQVCNYM